MSNTKVSRHDSLALAAMVMSLIITIIVGAAVLFVFIGGLIMVVEGFYDSANDVTVYLDVWIYILCLLITIAIFIWCIFVTKKVNRFYVDPVHNECKMRFKITILLIFDLVVGILLLCDTDF